MNMTQHKYYRNVWVWFICLSASLHACGEEKVMHPISPIHLDDIHYIVTNEEEAVTFFKKYFGAKEMAHPGKRFDLVRFLSIKWHDPTITITKIGPYKDLPAERNKRWLNTKIISPKYERNSPVYGSRWLAIATPSLQESYTALVNKGIKISQDRINLPMEPEVPAFSIYGPDSTEIVIVERANKDFGDFKYSIDHIQFLVKDIDESKRFYEAVLSATAIDSIDGSLSIKVADAKLILSEPKAFNIAPSRVKSRKQKGEIRIGLDHLGFLQSDIVSAVEQAKAKAYTPIFEPMRYIYKGEPTVYTFTAFATPEEFNIEFVEVDGRVGPHTYYECE